MRRYLLYMLFIVTAPYSFGMPNYISPVPQSDSLKQEVIKTDQENGKTHLIHLIDSLMEAANQAGDDSTKASFWLNIAENYNYSNPDSGIFYCEKALTLAKEINNPLIQIGSMGVMGKAYINKGNLPKAMALSIAAIELENQAQTGLNNLAGVGVSISNMGKIYSQLGNYEEALNYFRQMAHFGDEDIVGRAFGFLNLATVYE